MDVVSKLLRNLYCIYGNAVLLPSSFPMTAFQNCNIAELLLNANFLVFWIKYMKLSFSTACLMKT